MIDHFLVGIVRREVRCPVGVGWEPLDVHCGSTRWSNRVARSGARLGALPVEVNKLLALERDACQRGSAFLEIAVCHIHVNANKYPQMGALSEHLITITG
jgi:hypothetical protein